MGTKSIREIVETACVTHLGNQGLTGVSIQPGLSLSVIDPPLIVASAETASLIPELPQGLGNYSVSLQVMVFTQTDEASSQANHRARSEKVASAFADIAGLKAVFSSGGDATLYDVTFQSIQDSKGERAFGTTFLFELQCVLAP
jgi:hypothetical protein